MHFLLQFVVMNLVCLAVHRSIVKDGAERVEVVWDACVNPGKGV